MITIILAYLIAALGFVMICGGVYSLIDLWNQRPTSWHYAVTIGTICGGFGLLGIAQALRVLVTIAFTIQPH